MNTKQNEKCPDCGSELKYYHQHGGLSRAICSKKCNGWKVIKEIDRFKKEAK